MLSLHTATSRRGATVQPRSAELAAMYTAGLLHMPDRRTPVRTKTPQLQQESFEQFKRLDVDPSTKANPGVGVTLPDTVRLPLLVTDNVEEGVLDTDNEEERVLEPVLLRVTVLDADREGEKLSCRL